LLELIPSAADIVLADDSERGWAVEALRSGVRGVLARDATPSQIVAAVEAAAAGLVVLPAEDLENMLASSPAGAIDRIAQVRAKVEVLGMLAEGCQQQG
jgi:DNA-binding NarL/FixJ family response regulator